jgi:hypothetical protein
LGDCLIWAVFSSLKYPNFLACFFHQ